MKESNIIDNFLKGLDIGEWELISTSYKNQFLGYDKFGNPMHKKHLRYLLKCTRGNSIGDKIVQFLKSGKFPSVISAEYAND